MRLFPRDAHPRVRLVVELVVAGLGALALLWASRADLHYCERHLLLRYFAWDEGEKSVARHWRIAGIVVGLALLLVVRPLLGRWAGRRPAGEALADLARYGVSLVLALVASEVALRVMHVAAPRDRVHAIEVKIVQKDDRLGWAHIPSKLTIVRHGGRPVEYAVNAEQNRAAAVDDDPDYAAPTILFTGDSMTLGHGLQWDETYAALVSKELGVQGVDLGVYMYGADQAFLRLIDELPRYTNLVAVVALFHSPMLTRLDQDDHPHLLPPLDVPQPGLAPATTFWRDLRVARLWRNIVPYHDDHAFALAAQIYEEMDRRVRARGAKVLFVCPQFDHDVPRRDAWLLDEIFRSHGLPVLDVDFGFVRIPRDDHPNAESTRRLADAITRSLRSELAGP